MFHIFAAPSRPCDDTVVPNIKSQAPLDAVSKRRIDRQIARFNIQDPLRRSCLEHGLQLPMLIEYPGQFDSHALAAGGRRLRSSIRSIVHTPKLILR